MSWSDHLNEQLVRQGVPRCCLLGRKDGALWASSQHLLLPHECVTIAELTRNPKEFASVEAINISGTRYVITGRTENALVTQKVWVHLLAIRFS